MPALEIGAPAYPDDIIEAYKEANLSYPQMMTVQTLAVGSVITRGVLEGTHDWQTFLKSEPTPRQIDSLQEGMMSAHAANKVKLAPDIARMVRPIISGLVRGSRAKATMAIAAYGDHLKNPMRYDRSSHKIYDFEQYTQRHVDAATSIMGPAEDSKNMLAWDIITPEQAATRAVESAGALEALAHLWEAAGSELKPHNPTAVTAKQTIRDSIRLFKNPDAKPADVDEALQAYKEVPHTLLGLIYQGIDTHRDTIHEITGQRLTDAAVYHFVDNIITGIVLPPEVAYGY